MDNKGFKNFFADADDATAIAVVPINPTPKMITAGAAAASVQPEIAYAVYAAMIAAASKLERRDIH